MDMRLFTLSYVLLWATVLIQGGLLLALLYRVSTMRGPIAPARNSATFQVGELAPEFLARELRTNRAVSSATLRGLPRSLLFLSSECNSCRRLGHALSEGAQTADRLVVVCVGNALGCENSLRELARVAWVLFIDDLDAPFTLRLGGLPAILSVDEDWLIREISHPSSTGDIHAIDGEATRVTVRT